jgi:hypothetical protein
MPNDKQTDLMVHTEILLDKNDIVAIAVAEAEKKIRQNVAMCKAAVKNCDEKIESFEEEFELEGNAFLDKKANPRFKSIKTKISSLQLKLKTVLEYSTQPPEYCLQYSKDINSFTISIQTESDCSLTIVNETFPATKSQEAIAAKIATLNQAKINFISEGNDWKRKQSDIPALERQMRAQVARNEAEKTVTGKAMVKAMLDNLDATIKMIGV